MAVCSSVSTSRGAMSSAQTYSFEDDRLAIIVDDIGPFDLQEALWCTDNHFEP